MRCRQFGVVCVLSGFVCFGITAKSLGGPSLQLEQAEKYTNYRSYSKAADIYQTIIAQQPPSADSLEAYRLLIRMQFKAGNDTEAYLALDRMIADFYSYSELHREAVQTVLYDIAVEARVLGKYQQAKHVYEKVIQHDPGSWFAKRSQISLSTMDILTLIAAGDTAAPKAVDQFMTDFAEHWALPDDLYLMARAYLESGNYDEVQALCREIMRVGPETTYGLASQVLVPTVEVVSLLNGGNDTAAESGLAKLMADFRGHEALCDALWIIGEAYYDRAFQMEYEEKEELSRQYFRKMADIWEFALAVLPSSKIPWEAYLLAGVACERLGEYEKSIGCYRKVADEFPQSEYAWHAQFMVGRNYDKLAKSGGMTAEEAVPQIRSRYERLLEVHPECPAAKAAGYWLTEHDSSQGEEGQ
jgi:tetratricopeptide (TPR) repeat protein